MYIRPSRPDEIYHASHKYFMKIGEGKNARYFYTRNEYEAYKKEKGKKSSYEYDAQEINSDNKPHGEGVGKKVRLSKHEERLIKERRRAADTINDPSYLKKVKRGMIEKRRHAQILDTVASHHRLKREQEAADKYGHKAPPGESSAPKKRPRSRKKNVKKVISKIILGSRVGGKKLGGGRNGKS